MTTRLMESSSFSIDGGESRRARQAYLDAVYFQAVVRSGLAAMQEATSPDVAAQPTVEQGNR